MLRSRAPVVIACLVAGVAGAVGAMVACGSFSSSPDTAGGADGAVPQDGTVLPGTPDGSVDSGVDASRADGGSRGCKDAPDATLCVDFDEADPTTVFVNGTALGALPQAETTGGGLVELVSGGVSLPNALFASTPAHDGGAVARVRRPSYPVGSLAGKTAIRAELDWFIERLPPDVGGSVTFFEIGVGIAGGTCRIALQQEGGTPLLNFTCPSPVDQKPMLLPARGKWVHVTMRLSLDPMHAKGTIAIDGVPLAATAERVTPINPGEIYLVFGVDSSGGQSSAVRAGIDNIAVYAE
jgi:hypothetical protein